MRVLISSVGTRGDVQPAIALAVQLRELGGQARLCVPPNFVHWVSSLGFEARSIGVEMRAPSPSSAPVVGPVISDLVTDQFETVAAAAEGCDLIVGAGAYQFAVQSIAEMRGIPCVLAVYAPRSLPSADGEAWDKIRNFWNEQFRDRINANRLRLSLEPVEDAVGHILGQRPWLAADKTLSPLQPTPGLDVVQTGAWILTDSAPLPPEVEAFLAGGEPPVYLGFGSMPATGDLSRVLVEAARATGRRALLSEGWAGLRAVDDGADCLTIGEVNHQALFPRVAAVVHHGGAGTTMAAAVAGVPQVVSPMYADQPYWAERVASLGVGACLPPLEITPETLAVRLREVMKPAVGNTARALASRVSASGAEAAARRLLGMGD